MEFLGLRTVGYEVNDLNKAKEWYSKVLGVSPYFDQPFYAGFNVGGYELGLQPSEGEKMQKSSQVIAYWGVEDARKSLARIIELGATLKQDVLDVGEGILVATVFDPFGNVFGIIENPHFSNQE